MSPSEQTATGTGQTDATAATAATPAGNLGPEASSPAGSTPTGTGNWRDNLAATAERWLGRFTSRNTILFNGVMLGEIYTRMRGKRAYLMIGIYLLVLGGMVLVAYSSAVQGGGYRSGRNPAEIGREMFNSITMAQTFFMVLFVISITSSAITQEREQGTFEFLSLTLMQEHHIVWGKLMATVSFIALLMITGLPVMSIANLLGGFSFLDVLQSAGLITLGAINIGLFCLYGSASYQKTSTAMGANFGRMLLFLWITGVFFFDIASRSSYSQTSSIMPVFGLLLLNPFVPVGTLTTDFRVTFFSRTVPVLPVALLSTIAFAGLMTAYTSYLLKPAEKPRPEYPLRIAFLGFWVVNFTMLIGGFWHQPAQTLNANTWETLLFTSSYVPVLFLSFAIPILVRAPSRYLDVSVVTSRWRNLINYDLSYFVICVLVPFGVVALGSNIALDLGFYSHLHLFLMGLLLTLEIGVFYFLIGSLMLGLLGRSQPSLGRFLTFIVIGFFHLQTVYFASYDSYSWQRTTVTLNPIENLLLFLSPIFNLLSLFNDQFMPQRVQFLGRGDAFPVISIVFYFVLIGFLAMVIKALGLTDTGESRVAVQLPRRAGAKAGSSASSRAGDPGPDGAGSNEANDEPGPAANRDHPEPAPREAGASPPPAEPKAGDDGHKRGERSVIE